MFENQTKELASQGYTKLGAVIQPELADRWAQAFQHYVRYFNVDCDDQCGLSPRVYNYKPFVQLMLEVMPIVSKVLGSPVFPTYAYGRDYRHGEVLAKHKDRDACEVSVTLTMKKTQDWPIYIEGNAIELEVGDMVIYKGCDVEHWRKAYEGDDHVQVFLHYVDAHGSRSDELFDFPNRLKNEGLQ